MREERRKRRKRQQIITLVVCALAVAALIWGIATVVRKLTNYGNRSIASSQSDIQEDQPTDTSTADQTVEDRFAGVARNSYDAAGFYKEDGFLRYGDGTLGSEVGVDISSHQQSVDWEAVKAAGVDFAILRAGYRGYTEGAIQEDETFLTNLAAAKAAGLKVGVYFFSQALDKAEAVEEAEFVLNLLDGAELDYPIFFDWEDIEAERFAQRLHSGGIHLRACAPSNGLVDEPAGRLQDGANVPHHVAPAGGILEVKAGGGLPHLLVELAEHLTGGLLAAKHRKRGFDAPSILLA